MAGENGEMLYSPLAHGEMRLFELYRGRLDTEPLAGTLIAVQLDEAQYEALSYAWGDPDDVQPVIVNGIQRMITRNLSDALRCLRLVDSSRYLWIDAICINQHDLAEKNHQVLIMASIYQQAQGVICWLGLDSEDLQPLWALSESANPGGAFEDSQTYLQATISLTSRPWFSRIWTIQEFSMGNSPTFHCGTHRMSPWLLEEAINTLRVSQNIVSMTSRRYKSLLRSVTNLFKLRESPKSRSLEELVTSLNYLQYSEPRDCVYAWTSSAKDGRNIKPDYRKSVSEVYNDFVEDSISKSKSLDILFKPWAQNQSAEIYPSWVPTWSKDQVEVSIGSELTSLNDTEALETPDKLVHYNAHGRRGLSEGWSLDINRGLEVKGIALDEVTEVAHPAVNGEIPTDWITMGLNSFNGNPQSFWRTLVAGRDEVGRVPSGNFDNSMELILRMNRTNTSEGTNVLGLKGPVGYPELIRERIRTVIWNRSFSRSKSGRFGLLPAETRPGDLISILYGCSVPVILRKSISGQFFLIGECYVDGIMDGEAISTKNEDRWFNISPTRIANALVTIPMGMSFQWHFNLEDQQNKLRRQIRMPEASALDDERPTIWRQVRMRWYCGCGHQGNDVYTELRTGSMEMLAEDLRRDGVEVILEELGLTDPLTLLLDNLRTQLQIRYKNTWNSFKQQVPRSLKKAGLQLRAFAINIFNRRSPFTVPSSVQSSLTRIGTDTLQANEQGDPDFLLLCSKDGRWLTTWKDLEISKVLSDQQLFQLLREEYFSRKSLIKHYLGLKAICNIVFVKFALREQHEVDCLQPDQLPPLTASHYEFHERTPGRVPPISSEFLMHRFLSPSGCRSSTICLQQFPKRTGQAPVLGQAPDIFTGWGIYLQDGWSGERVCFWSFGVFILSLSFGIIWSVTHRNSIQDAFTVATYMLGTLASGFGCYQVMLSQT